MEYPYLPPLYKLTNQTAPMKKIALLLLSAFFALSAFAQSTDARMNSFIDGLMKKMTLEEKLGQLNLITPGSGIPT